MAFPTNLRFIFHLGMAAVSVGYVYLLYRMTQKSEGLLKDLWNQHVFLTNLSHSLITLYYLWVSTQDFISLLGIKSDQNKLSPSSQSNYTYQKGTHTFYQLILSLSMIVGLGYWSIMLHDQKLLFGTKDPEALNIYYAMYYLHGGNHLILYLELILYKQHTFVSKKIKALIDSITLGFYLTITAIQYFYFGRIVYAFQSQGLEYILPIYTLSILGFVFFDFGFSAIATKIGIFHQKEEIGEKVKKEK